MVDRSTTLPNRRYVWADTPKAARRKVGAALVKEGLALHQSLLPKLVTSWTGHTRSGRYEYVGNSVDGYKEEPSSTLRRYAVDIRP